MQLNEDSLRTGDLAYLVHHIFEIDSYKSKMGDDKDIVVLSFTVDGQEPANDLVSFIEKGYKFVLDADMTPGELSDGKYRVFVELERDRHVAENIVNLLYGIGKLAEVEDFKFRYYKSFDSKPADVETLSSVIPLSAEDYTRTIKTKALESYQHFFSNSMLENINMEDDIIEFKRMYTDPIRMKFIKEGTVEEILANTPARVAVDLNDISEVMFLTKYLGNYNINKLGNQYMLENQGYAIILERL